MTPRVKREFYWALMRHNGPTEMVLGHRTPPREPKLMMDMTPRIIGCIDEHLGHQIRLAYMAQFKARPLIQRGPRPTTTSIPDS